jgi:hydroxymethylpyrimidine pyrophosphatase-like HAD family hydrolase
MSNSVKTVFIDLDGTLIKFPKDRVEWTSNDEPQLLNGAFEKLLEWHRKGYRVIITTGRPENMRKVTESLLAKSGLIYDRLIMGLGCGERILINDYVNEKKADAFNVIRDEGISHICI